MVERVDHWNADAETLRAEKREGQVTSEMAALEKALMALRGRVEQVEERLAPVLRSVDEAKNAENPCEVLVPLADSIRGVRERVDRLGGRLMDILARLEL